MQHKKQNQIFLRISYMQREADLTLKIFLREIAKTCDYPSKPLLLEKFMAVAIPVERLLQQMRIQSAVFERQILT